MSIQTISFAELPRPPVGEGETAERLFAQVAEEYAAAARNTEPSIDLLPDATTRHLGGDGRDGWSRLRAQVLRANGAPVALGDYDVIRSIGAGGMGFVYEAVHRGRRQRVALKTLQQMSPSALFRFKNEFRFAQGVVHPNLCALYELVSAEDEWFFTMEYVEGESFRDSIRDEDGSFDEARLRDALLQVARGVRALHEAGKLHRDVNSSNVLITAEGRVVILDFGLISGEREGRREAGSFDQLSGTPGYMAPELGAGEAASKASDWYAVGVMLYEALTGRLPFMGTVRQVLVAKRAMDPTPPRQLNPRTPADLDALCLALLRRVPRERPAGREVLRRLGGDHEPVHLDPPSSADALIGREEQVLALTRAYAQIAAGRPVSVRVHGLAGVGKTALVRGFLGAIEQGGRALVLRGRCYERESVPYKAFDSLIDALAQHLRGLPEDEVAALLPAEFHALARLFPVLEGVPAPMPHCRVNLRDPQEVRRRAFTGLKELLRRLGAKRRLILSIDDMQWSDHDSALLLAELLSPPDPPALLLITTHRGGAASPSAPGEAIDLTLGPLSREHTIDLALRRMQLRTPDAEEIAARIAAESEGSPRRVEELARRVSIQSDADAARARDAVTC